MSLAGCPICKGCGWVERSRGARWKRCVCNRVIKGQWVKTPVGPGILREIIWDRANPGRSEALVEMDYSLLVQFRLEQLRLGQGGAADYDY